MVVTASYVGRLGRHLIQNVDAAMPTNLYDSASGQTYFEAATNYAKMIDAGVDPSVVPDTGYFHNLFPKFTTTQPDAPSTTALRPTTLCWLRTVATRPMLCGLPTQIARLLLPGRASDSSSRRPRRSMCSRRRAAATTARCSFRCAQSLRLRSRVRRELQLLEVDGRGIGSGAQRDRRQYGDQHVFRRTSGMRSRTSTFATTSLRTIRLRSRSVRVLRS